MRIFFIIKIKFFAICAFVLYQIHASTSGVGQDIDAAMDFISLHSNSVYLLLETDLTRWPKVWAKYVCSSRGWSSLMSQFSL